jgi:hypothetical protein
MSLLQRHTKSAALYHKARTDFSEEGEFEYNAERQNEKTKDWQTI